jgi:hypothetical protein
MMM